MCMVKTLSKRKGRFPKLKGSQFWGFHHSTNKKKCTYKINKIVIIFVLVSFAFNINVYIVNETYC